MIIIRDKDNRFIIREGKKRYQGFNDEPMTKRPEIDFKPLFPIRKMDEERKAAANDAKEKA